jgi:hypothetical protein
MPEWWTYTVSDFLLFSPRTYYRLIERYNAAVWPAHLAALAMGLGIALLLRRPARRHALIVSSFLAILWAWVAWAFLWKRYATINWAVAYLVPFFGLQVVLLVWSGIVRGALEFRISRNFAGVSGMAVFGLALLVYPLLATLVARDWRQTEVFGIAPDPTVIGTAGLLLLAQGRPRWELLIVPLLWCVLSGLTLWAMDSAEALLPPLLGLLIVIAGLSKAHRHGLVDPPGRPSRSPVV